MASARARCYLALAADTFADVCCLVCLPAVRCTTWRNYPSALLHTRRCFAFASNHQCNLQAPVCGVRLFARWLEFGVPPYPQLQSRRMPRTAMAMSRKSATVDCHRPFEQSS